MRRFGFWRVKLRRPTGAPRSVVEPERVGAAVATWRVGACPCPKGGWRPVLLVPELRRLVPTRWNIHTLVNFDEFVMYYRQI